MLSFEVYPNKCLRDDLGTEQRHVFPHQLCLEMASPSWQWEQRGDSDFAKLVDLMTEVGVANTVDGQLTSL